MKFRLFSTLIGMLSMVAVTTAEARPVRHIHVKPVVHHKVVVKPAPTYRVISAVADIHRVLPGNALRIVHAGETYYYHEGVYYVKEPRGYVVVHPFAGLRLASLPAGTVRVRIGEETLYRFNDVYYRFESGFYVVV